MGSKYEIRASRYPYPGYSEWSWQGESLVGFVRNLAKAMRGYEIVDVAIRDHRRMDKKDREKRDSQ